MFTLEYKKLKKKVFNMIEVGFVEDFIGRGYDVMNLSIIVINLVVSIMMTFDDIMVKYAGILTVIETVTVVFFLIDYILRLWTADCLFPKDKKAVAVLKYSFSFNGLVDMLSSVPFFLPFVFPAGLTAFRIFRVVRLFRIFRINAYFDSINVIGQVLKSKAKLLVSSVFVIFMLMLAASLCMYSLEHEAQPEAFNNAFSGIWWAENTLLTVGYGDIYPITPAGRLMAMVITLLGVGMVAIPTGIISAGFVEWYEKMKKYHSDKDELDKIYSRSDETDD